MEFSNINIIYEGEQKGLDSSVLEGHFESKCLVRLTESGDKMILKEHSGSYDCVDLVYEAMKLVMIYVYMILLAFLLANSEIQ